MPAPDKTDKVDKAPSSLVAAIHKFLGRLGSVNGTVNPDSTHNTGALLGAAYTWDEAERFCKAKSADAWRALAALITPHTAPGNYIDAESPSFMLTTKLSDPVRRFNDEALAQLLLKSKYKVPLHVTKELIAAAKLPTKSTVTSKVIERS